MRKSSPNPPKNVFQFSRNHPTLWPKETFLLSSSQPTNPQLSLSQIFSLVFPKNQQRNRMQACRLFWIAPIKRTDGEMERSFRSPKVRNVKHIPKKIRGLLGIAHSFPLDVPKDPCRSKSPRTSSSLAMAYPQMLSPSDSDPPHYPSTPITSAGFGNRVKGSGTGCDPFLKDPLPLLLKNLHSLCQIQM